MRELTVNEVELVDGGADWKQVAAGVAIIGLGIAIVSTGGLAAVPVGILGAATAGELVVAGAAVTATAGELVVAGAAVTAAGVGGAVIGSGATK